MHMQGSVGSEDNEVQPPPPNGSQAEGPASGAAAGAARADQDSFAEALQAVEELQNVTSYSTESAGPVDRIDAILLEGIEAEAVEARGEETESIPSSPARSDAADLQGPRAPNGVQLATNVHVRERVPCHGRATTLLWSASSRLGLELVTAIAALLPLGVWLLVSGDPAEVFLRLELVALFYAWCAARVASVLIFEVPMKWLGYPISPRYILLGKTLSGWPLTLILTAALCMLAPLMELDESAWRALHGTPRWWEVVSWWLASGITYVAVVSGARFYVSALTSSHYEQRARDAYRAQKVLRKISFAASRVRKASQKGAITRNATRIRWPSTAPATGHATTQADAEHRDPAGGAATPPTGHAPEPARYDLSQALAKHLQLLEGPLEFGAGFADASSLSQARRRAAKLFEDLAGAEWLHAARDAGGGGGGGDPTLSRDELLRWAYKVHSKGQPVDTVGAGLLFGALEVIDREQLVSSVERVYREQRLLIASIASFDSINVLLVRFCAAAWAALFTFLYMVALGVGFNEVLDPAHVLPTPPRVFPYLPISPSNFPYLPVSPSFSSRALL
jgi:hypothetical protein